VPSSLLFLKPLGTNAIMHHPQCYSQMKNRFQTGFPQGLLRLISASYTAVAFYSL